MRSIGCDFSFLLYFCCASQIPDAVSLRDLWLGCFLCEFADLFILLQLRCFITNGLPALLFTAECNMLQRVIVAA